MTCHTCHCVTQTGGSGAQTLGSTAPEVSHLSLVAAPAQNGERDVSSDSTLALLTVEEAARRLRIGRTYCYRLIRSGALESVFVGRLRRIPAEAIPEYVSKLRRSTTTAA